MINRKLKEWTWVFNEEEKTLEIHHTPTNRHLTLDKVRWFSLFRFMIRSAQRLSTKRRKKK